MENYCILMKYSKFVVMHVYIIIIALLYYLIRLTPDYYILAKTNYEPNNTRCEPSIMHQTRLIRWKSKRMKRVIVIIAFGLDKNVIIRPRTLLN